MIGNIFVFLSSYLIGSVPFAFITGKLVKGIDIRYAGEGNVGARNVLHTVGKPYGIIVGILDALKGVIVAILCLSLNLSFTTIVIGGFGVVLGHDFPIFLGFKGGKGLATAIGFLLILFPLPMVVSLTFMLIMFSIRRYFHFAVSIGIGSLPILWMPLFKNSFKEIIFTISYLSFLGIKRLIDEPHMREVKKKSGWDKG
ncbi:MAG: glycerol-3-phosphate acyltransferase [candidate division WOR-3 bacterium]